MNSQFYRWGTNLNQNKYMVVSAVTMATKVCSQLLTLLTIIILTSQCRFKWNLYCSFIVVCFGASFLSIVCKDRYLKFCTIGLYEHTYQFLWATFVFWRKVWRWWHCWPLRSCDDLYVLLVCYGSGFCSLLTVWQIFIIVGHV
jgi:hypothetical protein